MLWMIFGAMHSIWLYSHAVFRNLKVDFLHKFSNPNGKKFLYFYLFLVGGETIYRTTKEEKRGTDMITTL
ncbi:hypothetical protein AMTRI_Chr04g247850 [Amborella trichopoda]